ncbi:MAG: hypothetical protein FWD33_02445 [Alphaproteobacteria bacterium]|nr:hypothetical protein [Alphaproteobacteria bacterium]
MMFARIFAVLAAVLIVAEAGANVVASGRPSVAPHAAMATRGTLAGAANTRLWNTPGVALGAVNAAIVQGDAAVSERSLSESECINQARRCLFRESACGEEFELCTTYEEFIANNGPCRNGFRECDNNGRIALFGAGNQNLQALSNEAALGDGSLIKRWIDQGAAWAVQNSATACSRAFVRCATDVCSENPFRCDRAAVYEDRINACMATASAANITMTIQACEAQEERHSPLRVVRAACIDRVGHNRECRRISGLNDPDSVTEWAYDNYMSRIDIISMMSQFTANQEARCNADIDGCIRRNCGGGTALVCYTDAKAGGTSVDGSGIQRVIGTSCNEMNRGSAACLFVGRPAPTNSDFDRIAALLNGMFDPNSARRVEVACMQVLDSCVTDKCGENLFGCSQITGAGARGLQVRLNENSVKAFCWNPVVMDENCDMYFQIMGASKGAGSSILGAWGNVSGVTLHFTNTDANDPEVQRQAQVAVEANKNAVFRDMLGMLERNATAQRQSEYERKMNMCQAVGGNTLWGARDLLDDIENPWWKEVEPVNIATRGITDTCFSRVSIAVQGDQEVVRQVGNTLNAHTVYVPAGTTIICGQWLRQDIFNTVLRNFQNTTRDRIKDTTKNARLWTNVAAIVGGAGVGGTAGYFGGRALSGIAGGRDNQSAAIGEISSALTALGTQRAVDGGAVTAASVVGRINAAKSMIANSTLTEGFKASVASVTVAETANAETANAAFDQLRGLLNAERNRLQNADGNLNDRGRGITTTTTVVGAAGGIWAGTWLANESFKNAREGQALTAREEFEVRIGEAMRCTVSLVGGRTRTLELGESFTVPELR